MKKAQGRFAQKFPRAVDQITNARELEALHFLCAQCVHMLLEYIPSWQALDLIVTKKGKVSVLNTSQMIHRMSTSKGYYNMPCITSSP